MEKTEIKDGRKYWVIRVDAEDLFRRVSLDSNYRAHTVGSGDSSVMLNDDMALFRMLMRAAAADLWLKLGRMGKHTPCAFRSCDDGLSIRLEVGENYDDNMACVLDGFIEEYLHSHVLCQWLERCGARDALMFCAARRDEVLGNMLNAVHYRAGRVNRSIGPVF